MGSKLNWTGLFLINGAAILNAPKEYVIAGAVIFLIGIVLMWMDK